ncbi:replication initiation and membrane attachment family protein [Alkalibacillus sp. S2W]|uniref:replication initiation and membrane attachment family protein n=1 Tax=Alkalibacillus sp. S2W TaxID=3386553 RepID=UPI00398D2C1D
MNQRMKHLLPNDQCVIMKRTAFFEDANTVLTLLYQPLIGMKSVALYQALWREHGARSSQTAFSHHHLMGILNMSLDEIYEARQKLEGIGLLKTFKQDETYRTYYYVLRKPLSSYQFFDNPTLTILLEHHIGKEAHQALKQQLAPSQQLDQAIDEVTAHFDDVFTTVKHLRQPAKKTTEESIVMTSDLPLEWLYKMLTQQQIEPKQILTKSNLNYMERVSKIYDVDYLELEKALLWAINEEMAFDRQEFLDMCKDIYYNKHGSVPPRLYAKQDVETEHNEAQQVEVEHSAQPSDAESKQAKLIEHFNTITHRELLEDYATSGLASMKEVDMLTNVMEEHGLNQPVMNVLVHYVLNKNGNKLNRNYIETIAAHWSREGIETAQQAIELAKQEHKLYQTWQQKKQRQGSKQSNSKKSSEVIPKWFKEQKQKKQSEDQSNDQQEAETQDEDLAAFFKSFSQPKQ